MDWTEEANKFDEDNPVQAKANNAENEIKRLRGWLVRIVEGPCLFPMHRNDMSKCDLECAQFMAKEAVNGKRT